VAPVRIRHATLDDLDAVQDVYRRASLSNDGDRPHLLAHPDALDFPDVAIREARTRVACLGDGSIVGFITAELHRDGLEIVDLFVAPEWMRHGIGRTLVSDAASAAAEAGLDRLEVTGNGHALAFYLGVGFAVDHLVETRFGSGYRLHRDIASPARDAGPGRRGGRPGQSHTPPSS
jgi:ribosomal protein S18 acetylase RimI-like enzyme